MYHHFNSGRVAVILITDSRPFEFSVPRTNSDRSKLHIIVVDHDFLPISDFYLLIVGVYDMT